MLVPDAPDVRWSLDFIRDALTDGRRFRVLAVVDDHTRECIALAIVLGPMADHGSPSLSGQRVVRELDIVIARRGHPAMIVSDNGTEFTSMAILSEVPAHRDRMALHRARQTDARHGFIESFNGRFRDEMLNGPLFSSLGHARQEICASQHDDNHHRPHSGLGNIPPAEVVAKRELEMRAA